MSDHLDRARTWVNTNTVLTGLLAVMATTAVTGLMHIAFGG